MSLEQELRDLREQVASLTRRIWVLEQKLGTTANVAAPPPPLFRTDDSARTEERSAEETTEQASRRAETIPWPHPSAEARPVAQESLESRIGSQWLNRIGVIAVLVGVSYFLKLAFDNNWIGPATRVLIGIAAGIAIFVWSERFRRNNAIGFSHSLKAIGIGIEYLSLWAASEQYQLIPTSLAFVAMFAVTVATAYVAVRQDSELVAGMAATGGFLTPVLLSSNQNREVTLFSYIALLSAGALAVQRYKPWVRVLLGSFVAWAGLYVAWSNEYAKTSPFGLTVVFISVIFLIYFAAPLVSVPQQTSGTRAVLAILPIVNTTFYFLQYRELAEIFKVESSAGVALTIAVLCFGMGHTLSRREAEGRWSELSAPLVHQALAVTWLTVALGLKLTTHWMTLGWLVEAAALFYAGQRTSRREIKALSAAVALLAIIHLLFIDSIGWHPQPLIFNARFGLYLLAAAVIGWMVYLESGGKLDITRQSDRAALFAVGIVLLNALILIALNLEVSDYYAAQIREVSQPGKLIDFTEVRALKIARDFSYSAVWLLYGVALMVIGFTKRSSFVRWMAIILIGVTVVKVFVYDVSALDRVFRVASFIILGVILLGISYAYQRDMLGLRREEERT